MRALLLRGLTAGALLALAENLLALFTGYNVPLETLGLTLGIDVLVGVLAGCVSSLLLGPSGSRKAAFFVLATAMTCLFEEERIRAAIQNRGLVFVLCLVSGGLAAAALLSRWKGLKRLDGPGNTELAVAGALLVSNACLVASYLLMKEASGRFLSAKSLALHGGLAVLTLVVLSLVIRACLRVPFERVPKTPAGVAGLAIGLTLSVSVVCWAARLPRDTPVARSHASRTKATGPSIVLISLDTLRADHVSCYGYERSTTPRLDAFAKASDVYRNAFSPAAWTLPAHVSMLSGEPPRRHRSDLSENRLTPIHAETVLASEILGRAGYRTGAVVANSILLRPSLGFDRGFDFFDSRLRRFYGYQPVSHDILGRLSTLERDRLVKPTRDARVILDEALDWIGGRAETPFFLFINLMEPHPPWVPARGLQDVFPGRSPRLPRPSPDTLDRVLRGEETLDGRIRDNALALYDGAIASMDAELGRFFEKLAARGLYDGALLIVTADHGEFFNEHRRWGHGYGPYDEVYRVPLLVKHPGGTPKGARTDWVDTTRIFSTILQAAGLPAPAGIDFDPLGSADPRPTRSIATEQPRLRPGRETRPYQLLREDPWKLIAFEDSFELYDVRRDPGELHDLSGQESLLVKEMRGRLATWTVSNHPRREESSAASRDQELLKKLLALGYLR